MSGAAFRFVHASDLHLETPVHGLLEVPDLVREDLLEAPYRAAQAVFDTACHQGVDFVILAGDVVDLPLAGPRAIVFLLEQFERLNERNVTVYWAGGRVDSPDEWPATVPLPRNVHVFPAGHVEAVVHHRGGLPLARIAGTSRTRRVRTSLDAFNPDPAAPQLPTIGVLHGPVEVPAIERQRTTYLALGGQHARRTLSTSPTLAHYPGTPQGRSPQEPGAHGVTLVEVDEGGRCRTRLEVTDSVRWLAERIELPRNCDRDHLNAILDERTEALRETAGGRMLLVAWIVGGAAPLVHELRSGTLTDTVLTRLRNQYGPPPASIWSASLTAEPIAALPRQWYEQDTILGEFLRLVRQYQGEPDLPLRLAAYLSQRHITGPLAEAVALESRQSRDRVLRDVAVLGADLLGGDWAIAAAREGQR